MRFCGMLAVYVVLYLNLQLNVLLSSTSEHMDRYMGIDGVGDAFRLSVKYFFLHLPIVPLSWCGCLTMLLPLLTLMANCLHGLYERIFLFFSQSNRNESSYCGIAHITEFFFLLLLPRVIWTIVRFLFGWLHKWNLMKINLITFQLIVDRFEFHRESRKKKNE